MNKVIRIFLNTILVIVLVSITNINGLNARTLNGVVKTHFSNGKLKSEVSYKNGKRHGWSIYYVKDGRLKEKTHYLNGIKNGWSKIFYDDGMRLYLQCYYVNGMKHGWSFSGRKINVGNGFFSEKAMYRNGKKIGKIYRSYNVSNLARRGISYRDIDGGYNPGNIDEERNNYDGSQFSSDDFNCPNRLILPKKSKYTKWPAPFSGYHDGDYFHPDNLIDGIKETVWVSFYNDYKKNKFFNERIIDGTVKYLIIVNGNRLSNKEYYKYSRIKSALLIFNFMGRKKTKIIRKIVHFHDNFEIKRIPIFNKKHVGVWAEMRIKSIYPGRKYKNLAISDFYFEY